MNWRNFVAWIVTFTICTIKLSVLWTFFQSHTALKIMHQSLTVINGTLHSVWPDWAIFLTLGYFLRPLATINLPKSLTFLGIFVKVSKSILFLVKSFLGNFYRHLAIFIWSHCCELKMYSVVRLIWFRLLVNRLHELHRCQMAEAVAAVAAPFELSMRDSVGIVVVATRKQCDQLLE